MTEVDFIRNRIKLFCSSGMVCANDIVFRLEFDNDRLQGGLMVFQNIQLKIQLSTP